MALSEYAHAACIMSMICLPTSTWADETAASDTVYFGVRLLRTTAGAPLEWDVVLPQDCNTCSVDRSSTAAGQNSLELFFHIRAPNDREILRNIRVVVPSREVRRVLISRTEGTYSRTARFRGTRDATFRKDDTGISFDIPYALLDPGLPSHDLGDVTQQYTYIQTPGVDVRIEHARPERVNGPYRDGVWPAVQRQAALNLQFAARDAVERLGLDRLMVDRKIGTIILSGFDTNYPTSSPTTAHADFPPHWHMQLAWDQGERFRRVGHKYIDDHGLLEKNTVSVTDRNAARTSHNLLLGRGETDRTNDAEGQLIYFHRITPKGYFELGTAAGTCLFQPANGGFDSGVDLDCGKHGTVNGIKVLDDPEHGQLQVFRSGRLAEHHLYDRDSARLISSERLTPLLVQGKP